MLSKGARTWAGCLVVALIGLVPQFLSRTSPDVAFPLWTAGSLLDGATLYVDILEVNPPLFIWLDIPVVALARWAGLDPILMFRLALTVLFAASVWLTHRILADGQSDTRMDGRTDVLSAMAITFVLFVLPRLDWGEREHMALALMLPWLALAAQRVEGREVSGWTALLVGLAAGLGIALKPHFVLVWIGREAAVWKGRQLGRTDGRTGGQTKGTWVAQPDTWAPVAVCVAYLGAVFAVSPEYFPLAREVAGPYSRFIRVTVLGTLIGLAPAVALSAIVAAAGLRGLLAAEAANRRAAVQVLWCVTAAWSVVAVLQLKGFRYHWYPAMALGMLLLCHLALVARGVHIPFASRLFRAIATASAVTTVVLASWSAVRHAATPLSPEWDADPSIGPLLEELEARVEPGDALAVLSPNMASGFQLTNYLETEWQLRMPHLWPAVSEYRAQLDAGLDQEVRAEAEATEMERQALRLVAEDLDRSRPKWLLLFRHMSHPDAPYMSRVRIREFIGRDSLANAIMNEYDSLSTVGLYTIWVRDKAEGLR